MLRWLLRVQQLLCCNIRKPFKHASFPAFFLDFWARKKIVFLTLFQKKVSTFAIVFASKKRISINFKLLRVARVIQLLGCQQAKLEVVVKKRLRRLLANRKKVNKGLSIHIGSTNFYIVLNGDVVKQLNAILEKNNNVSFTKTEGK